MFLVTNIKRFPPGHCLDGFVCLFAKYNSVSYEQILMQCSGNVNNGTKSCNLSGDSGRCFDQQFFYDFFYFLSDWVIFSVCVHTSLVNRQITWPKNTRHTTTISYLSFKIVFSLSMR